MFGESGTLNPSPDTPARTADASLQTPAASEHSDPLAWPVVAVFILALLLGSHIWSIDTGRYLDDHAHYQNMRHSGWSFAEAVEASRLDIVGKVLDLWAAPEQGLRFFRPIAFWIMKAEYTLVGWHPMGMHLFSLGWHFACCLLTAVLAVKCLGRRIWGLVAGGLVAIHPGHVATVYWIACQTELITTTFLLLAVLSYGRFSGWGQRLFLRDAGERDAAGHGTSGAGSWFYGTACLTLYALALGCRENALLFPFVCFAGDRCFGSRSRRWLRPIYLLMLILLAGYFLIRWQALGGFSLPARPYIMPASDPDFPLFIVNKVIYYVLGLFAYVPIVPFGGQAYFAERDLSFYGSFAGVVAVLLLVWSAFRFRRSLMWPIVWMGLLSAPVLPVFASSHHLYLPGVGAVVVMTAGLAALGGATRPKGQPAPRAQAMTCAVVLLLHAVGLSLFSWSSGFAYRAGTWAEDLLVDDVLRYGRPVKPGDHLFFINMPLLAYYTNLAVQERTGIDDLRAHVLTFAPWLSRMEAPGTYEVIDRHRIRVRAPREAAYFQGITGGTLREMLGHPAPFQQGEVINARLFTVTITEADPTGVREMLFTFHEPLDSPNYHFFFGSPRVMGYPVNVAR